MAKRYWILLLGLTLLAGAGGALAVHALQDLTSPQQEKRPWVSNDPVDVPLPPGQLSDLPVGHQAPDFVLRSLRGDGDVRLSDLWKDKPLVLLFGSYSCSVFDAQVPNWQALYEKYQNRVGFLIVNIHEANHFPRPLPCIYEGEDLSKDTTDIRSQRSCRAEEYLHITIPTVLDPENRQAELAYGSFPTRLVVVGRGGKVVLSAGSHMLALRNINQFELWLKGYLAGKQ